MRLKAVGQAGEPSESFGRGSSQDSAQAERPDPEARGILLSAHGEERRATNILSPSLAPWLELSSKPGPKGGNGAGSFQLAPRFPVARSG
jgi:hypothetical protein